jgi:hypothetical protein
MASEMENYSNSSYQEGFRPNQITEIELVKEPDIMEAATVPS